MADRIVLYVGMDESVAVAVRRVIVVVDVR